MKVECWFCRKVIAVPAGNENCFDCPECDQYNGFTPDGDYNKPIPAQYREDLNPPSSRASLHQRSRGQAPSTSPLCHVCQTNHELKVQQLASFIPTHENNFEAEVEDYARYLEEAYRLCPTCNGLVQSDIRKQDADIGSKQLSQRLNQALASNKQVSSLQLSKGWTRGQMVVSLLRVIAILCAYSVHIAELAQILDSIDAAYQQRFGLLVKICHLLAIAQSRKMTMSLSGLVCTVVSSLVAGKYRLRYLDCLCPVLWILYLGSISAALRPSSLAFLKALPAVLPWMSTDAVPFLLSGLLLLSGISHALQMRVRTTKRMYRNRPVADQPHAPSLHESFEEEENLEPNVTVHEVPETRLTALSQSLQSENGEIKRILLDHDIGGLSLGPPGMTRPRNKDVWTAHTPPTSRPATPLMDERPPSREFRPIISPATFNPSGMNRSASQSSFVSAFNGAFTPNQPPWQEQRVTSSREQVTDSGRGSSRPIFEDDSSNSSLPLGSSALKLHSPSQSYGNHSLNQPGWTSFFLPCFFGFSLGINVAAGVYFMYGR